MGRQKRRILIGADIIVGIAISTPSTERGRRMPRAPKQSEKTPTTRLKRTQRTKETPQTVSDLEISRLAYQLYEARGRTDGAQLDDWLRAEQQLSREER